MVGAIHKNLSPRNFSTYHKESMEEYGRDCCVRGYHVYQEIWEAAVGEVLVCEREPRNVEDRYAVAVKTEQLSDTCRGKYHAFVHVLADFGPNSRIVPLVRPTFSFVPVKNFLHFSICFSYC